MKINYLLIPLFAIAVSSLGSYFTSNAVNSWYLAIKKPSFTPPGSVIGAVWTVIFILATISVLIVWNKFDHNAYFWKIIGVFIVNGFLNILWSYLFFYKHSMYLAIWEAGILCLSVLVLIFLIWPLSAMAASLLVPYSAWVAFATYLTYTLYYLNK